jgi:hypothetical protein
VDIDASQVSRLAADLGKVGFTAVARIRPVVAKALADTKADLQGEAGAVGHYGVPGSITYDVTMSGLGGEVGPVTGGPGSLAFFYYGNSKVGAQLPDPMFAMRRNADKALPFFAKVLGEGL